jgi:hypothetical protein
MSETMYATAEIRGTHAGRDLRYVGGNTAFTIDGDVDPITVVLAASAADGNVTLWDAAVSPAGAFKALGVFVDPGETLSDTDKDEAVNVELTIDGVVVAFQVRRALPLLLATDEGGGAIDAIGGKITKVRVRNESAVVIPVSLVALD